MVMAHIAIMMNAIMAVVGVIKVQNDIGEEHVLVRMVTVSQMLDARHGAGHCGQHKNLHERNTQQRARLFRQPVMTSFHPARLVLTAEAGNARAGPLAQA